jgi:hypothetical protein
MRRLAAPGLLLASVLAISALASTAHASVEGPYDTVEGLRLSAGETKSAAILAAAPFVIKGGTVKVECKQLKSQSAKLNGSTGANAATAKGIYEFSECKGGAKEEKLEGCEPTSAKFTSSNIVETWGYANSTRSGELLLLLAPETGSSIATVHFTGSSCQVSSGSLSGSIVGEAYAGQLPDEAESEVEAPENEVKFTPTAKTIWIERGGSLKSIKPTFEAFSAKGTLEGESSIALTTSKEGEKEEWGPIASVKNGFMHIRPHRWIFRAGERLGFKVVNLTGNVEEVKSGGLMPNGGIFKIFSGRGCFEMKRYQPAAVCVIRIEPMAGAMGEEDLEIVPDEVMVETAELKI